MSLRERQPYMEESERLKQLHARQYPTYKVTFCLALPCLENFTDCLRSINHVNEAKPIHQRM